MSESCSGTPDVFEILRNFIKSNSPAAKIGENIVRRAALEFKVQ